MIKTNIFLKKIKKIANFASQNLYKKMLALMACACNPWKTETGGSLGPNG